MSTLSVDIAEVYLMRKLHKEKMTRELENKRTKEKAASEGKISDSNKRSKKNAVEGKKSTFAGCLPIVFKKVHPNSVPSSSK